MQQHNQGGFRSLRVLPAPADDGAARAVRVVVNRAEIFPHEFRQLQALADELSLGDSAMLFNPTNVSLGARRKTPDIISRFSRLLCCWFHGSQGFFLPA